MLIGIGAGVGGIILIIVIVIAILWCMKSKRREKERFERAASIRSSLNNLNKINSSLRGTKSTLTMMSEGQSRRRLNELDERSMGSSIITKKSQSSNGSVHSFYSNPPVVDEPDPGPTSRQQYTRPVHSLRPNRSGGRNMPMAKEQERDDQKQKGRQQERQQVEQQRERDRIERDRRMKEAGRRRQYHSDEDEEDEKRGEYKDNSDDDNSIRKDTDDEYFTDSSFDDEEDERESARGKDKDDIDANNIQYRVSRSQERLFEKSPNGAAAAKPTYGAGARSRSRDDIYDREAEPLPHKSKSLSSFAMPETRNNYPRKSGLPLSPSRENLPPPPPPSSNYDRQYQPKPLPRPKPQKYSSSVLSSASGSQDSPRPGPAPVPRSRGSQEGLFDNKQPVSQVPFSDPTYLNDEASEKSGRSGPFYNNMHVPGSVPNRGPLYDSVYKGSGSLVSSQGLPYDPVPLNDTSSNSRYEPIDYNSVDLNPYGKDQVPDIDYMPRPRDNPSGGRSRERLGPPPPALLPKPSFLGRPQESDLDSYAPSLQSDVDYMPRQHPPSVSDRFNDPLPPKPGASYIPDTHSVSDRPPGRGSRDYLDRLPQPPPYSRNIEHPSSHSGSRDRLNFAPPSVIGSSMSEEPPPYSPGEEPRSRGQRGSRDMLYLDPGGARPRQSNAMETEI